MKNLIAILLLLCAFSASAATRITALITATNVADTGDTIVVNASSRYWTNANSSSTILTNLVGKNQTITNLYNQIAAYPYTGPITVQYADTNQIRLIGALDGALAVTVAGGWATVSLSTQSGPQTYTALWPIENIVDATNRTNQASAFVSGMSTYATNAFATNSTAMSNFITKGASPLQTIASELRVVGNINNGANSLSVSNLENRGNPIRSFGSGGNSFAAGSNATASGSRSVVIGNSAVASGTDSLAAGTSSQATNSSATAVGVSSIAAQNSAAFGTTATASGNNSTSIGSASQATGSGSSAIGNLTQATGQGAYAAGQGAQATADYSIAIGNEDTLASGTNGIAIGLDSTSSGYRGSALGAGAAASHDHSTAIGGYDHTGTASGTTTTNQIRLGTGSQTVSVPGVLEVSGTQTNTTFTGTNVLSGRLTLTPRSNTSLANGYNSGVVLGTNVYIRFSGPSAAYTNAGFASAPDGTYHVAQFDNPGLSFTILDNSGTEATAANRVYTGTGALLNSTNNPAIATLIYDGNVSRWRVVSFR